jgi:hypothetical protein
VEEASLLMPPPLENINSSQDAALFEHIGPVHPSRIDWNIILDNHFA